VVVASRKIIGTAMERMPSGAIGEWKHATYDRVITPNGKTALGINFNSSMVTNPDTATKITEPL
jgi:hypothetical protein